MAASTIQSNAVLGRDPIPAPSAAGELIAQRSKLEVATTSLDEVNDTLEMLVLPAGCVPVDVRLSCDDLDTHATPTLTFHVGITSDPDDPAEADTKKDIDAFIASTTIGRTGGIATGNVITLPEFTPVDRNLMVGVTVAAVAATAATGTLILEMIYRAKQPGE